MLSIAFGGRALAFDGAVLVPPRGAPDVTLPEGWTVTPGLVDLQVNGMGDAFPLEDPSSIERLDGLLLSAGVTAYLVAAPSAPAEQVRALAGVAASFDSPGFLGLHLEGPVLSPLFPGAHPLEHLRDGEDAATRALLDLPRVRVITLAPEVHGARVYAREAIARGIVVAAGHTGASLEQARDAIDDGITLATHLFNAMTPVHHRAPGAVLAYLLDPRARFTFIADGVHLDDAILDLILRVAGDRAVLVSDSAPEGGVHERARPEGVLAGSAATIADGVRRIASLANAPLAARLASEAPAAVLGDPARGTLELGARADLTVWDEHMRVAATIRGGEIVYRAPSSAGML